jgi:DNA modification methylase
MNSPEKPERMGTARTMSRKSPGATRPVQHNARAAVDLSRRKNQGRHTVVPLHASILEHCRRVGFDNVQGIFWCKIANAAYEVENGSSFLGKPYEPNAIIKNDVEYILMQRKPGGYWSPALATRVMSVISEENYQKWFRLVWDDLPGAPTKRHPAPYPIELAERLVRMLQGRERGRCCLQGWDYDEGLRSDTA